MKNSSQMGYHCTINHSWEGPLIVKLISNDGRDIKEIRENSGNCSQEYKNMSNRHEIGKKL
ncbi:hypothetical protein ES705_30546 [subsurface metagenome]